jgi:hypothetical protein
MSPFRFGAETTELHAPVTVVFFVRLPERLCIVARVEHLPRHLPLYACYVCVRHN